MSFEPHSVPLSQIAKLRSGFPFKSADWQSSGVPVIKITNVKGGRISQDGCGFVTHAVASTVPEWMTKDGDVLIAMTGYVGEVAWVRPGERFLINQRVGRFEFLNDSTVLPGFLYYYLLQPEIRFALEDMARGSAQPNLSAGDAAKLPVPVLPLSHQRQIVSFGRALDDRIDNLRATNATLEAIAQSIFKSWFIDFDPVRAKMESREPEGMDAETAALFPNEFEESELGLIPRGWRVQPIGELAEIVGGSTPDTKNEDYWAPGVFHWTSPKDLSGATAPVLIDTERLVSEAGLTKISSGLLPPETLLLSSRAPIGYLSLSKIPVAINQGYIAMLPGGALPTVYLYFWTQANMEVIKDRSNGSTFMEISKKMFRPINALVPPQAVVGRFAGVAESFFDRITANERQAHHLSDLRDLLLPRLISGKISIGAAGAALEAA